MSARPRPVTCERGFSLLEVLISSLIMLLVMGALYTSLEQTEVFYESYEASMTLRQQARVTMARMATDLRSAGYDIGDLTDAISLADGDDLQFIGDIDDGDDGGPCGSEFEDASGGGAERITYSRDDDNNLIRTVDCWDGSAWTLSVESSTMLTGLDPDQVIFEYLDVSGTTLPTVGGALASDVLGDVRSVIINLVLSNEDQTVGAGDDVPASFRLSHHVRLVNLEELGDL